MIASQPAAVLVSSNEKSPRSPQLYTDDQAKSLDRILRIPLSRPYEILDLPETAEKGEVYRAFKKLALPKMPTAVTVILTLVLRSEMRMVRARRTMTATLG